jgi:hypothetical protein
VNWLLEMMMKRSRVYILPTRMGGYFNGLIFLMFLLSVGYSNNLMLIFTLILFGFNLIWVIQTHQHLETMKIQEVDIQDGHANESILVSLFWLQAPEGPYERRFTLIAQNTEVGLNVHNDEQDITKGFFSLTKRGEVSWRYLRIESERPVGLYKTWKYFRLKEKSFIYPALFPHFIPPLLQNSSLEGEEVTGKKGEGDFHGLARYSGQEMRKISWKHYARVGDLLVKEGEDTRSPTAELILSDDKDKEQQLSILATQIRHCHQGNIPWTLELYGIRVGPACNLEHFEESLRRLSVC